MDRKPWKWCPACGSDELDFVRQISNSFFWSWSANNYEECGIIFQEVGKAVENIKQEIN